MTYFDTIPAPQRMLIIEDEPRDARMLEAMLRHGGESKFAFSHAGSIAQAEQHLSEDKPDVIILDLQLPDATELEGLTRLREYASQIPIIVFTGTEDENLAVAALQRGAEDYLTKGNVDRDRLVRSVRYAIERHKTVRELATVTNDLQHANATLEKLALLDPLTDLLNRRGLQQAVSREIERVQREGLRVLVLLVDLDDFKEMNDQHGHAVGDIVLMEVSRRLKGAVRAVDYVARIGGDEFVLLLPRAEGNLVAIAERIRLAVATTTIQLASGPFRPTASLAAMMLSTDMPSIEQILAHAHRILRRSKDRGKNCVSYEGAQFDDTNERRRAQADLCNKLVRGEGMRSVKQAIYCINREKVIGYEFLSRFVHGEHPENVFRLSSERNILTVVDHHCLKHAIAAACESELVGTKHVNLFPSTIVSIPPQHLLEEFPRDSADRFCVEISEQQILGDPGYLRDSVDALRDAGIQIAIDDVGFGNSCLESLVILEPDVIKIDKRCVIGIAGDERRQKHLKRYISLAHELSAEIIVEGIESRAELDTLRTLGVQFGQGFLWGTPA